MDNSELIKLLKERNEQFKELEKLGIVSTESNHENRDVPSIQVGMNVFDEKFKGVPFSIQNRNSDSYPYKLVIEVEGVKFFVLISLEAFKDRFWKPTSKLLVNDKDVFSAEVVSCECYECGSTCIVSTQDVVYMNYCPTCGAKINKKEFTLTRENTKNEY